MNEDVYEIKSYCRWFYEKFCCPEFNVKKVGECKYSGMWMHCHKDFAGPEEEPVNDLSKGEIKWQ